MQMPKPEYRVAKYDSVDELEADLAKLEEGWALQTVVQGAVKVVAIYTKFQLATLSLSPAKTAAAAADVPKPTA